VKKRSSGRGFEHALGDGLESLLQRLHHERQRADHRRHHQPAEGEGQPPDTQPLRKLPHRTGRTHQQQQVKAHHRGRQHQRHGHQRQPQRLEARARARQRPGQRRADEQQDQRTGGGQLGRQPHGGPFGGGHGP
jgi:hypothetical protein